MRRVQVDVNDRQPDLATCKFIGLFTPRNRFSQHPDSVAGCVDHSLRSSYFAFWSSTRAVAKGMSASSSTRVCAALLATYSMKDARRVRECHITIGHIACSMVEQLAPGLLFICSPTPENGGIANFF